MSAGTVGRSRLGGEVGLAERRERRWEKYPELAAREDLLQAIGVPPALTIRSRLREGEGSIAARGELRGCQLS